MYRNENMDYRGFCITLETRSYFVYAFWCNDKHEASRKFSGYSMSEIKAIIRQDIDDKLAFDYNKYCPTEEDFPTSAISDLIIKHDLVVTKELLQLARACWAEAKIHNESQTA